MLIHFHYGDSEAIVGDSYTYYPHAPGLTVNGKMFVD